VYENQLKTEVKVNYRVYENQLKTEVMVDYRVYENQLTLSWFCRRSASSQSLPKLAAQDKMLPTSTPNHTTMSAGAARKPVTAGARKKDVCTSLLTTLYRKGRVFI